MVPIVDGTFMIEKFLSKGGWTYVLLPQLESNKNAPFGWRNVFGTIDNLFIEKLIVVRKYQESGVFITSALYSRYIKNSLKAERSIYEN